MILLDTHAWLWWVGNPKKLSTAARKAIEKSAPGEALGVSCISTWELTMLHFRGRIELTMDVSDWLKKVEALPYFRFIPVDNGIALRSVLLPDPLHRDPADRIIVATAIEHSATLVTMDEKLLRYPHVRTVG